MRLFTRILSTAFLGLCAISAMAWNENDSWPSANGNLENTRSSQDTSITKDNAKYLIPKWVYKTSPDVDPASANLGSVGVTPAVEGDFVYFTDLAGYLYKNKRSDGTNVWKKHLLNDLSIPGYTMTNSRNTPLVMGNLLILGGTYWVADQLCAVVAARTGNPAPPPAPGGCHNGDGAIVIAVNKNNGSVVWRTKVDDHPSAKISGSLSGEGNSVYVGVSSWEEDWARIYPDVKKLSNGTFAIDLTKPYKCCSVRGSVVKLDLDGNIKWKTYVSSGLDKENKLPSALHKLLTTNDNGTPGKGFFGVSPYGHSPTIDLQRRQVYVANSQTETAPQAAEQCEKYRRYKLGIRPDLYPAVPNPDNSTRFKNAGVTCATLNEKLKTYGNAVIALDMDSGKVKWAFYARPYDAWNHACAAPDFDAFTGVALPFVFPVPLSNNANCFQDPIGPDYGFGSNPLLLKELNLVVAGNKDGRLFALNPDTGKQVWQKSLEAGGIYGGVHFGMATDGKTLYTGTANSINTGRDRTQPYVSAKNFLAADGLDQLLTGPGLSLNEKPGSVTNLKEWPGPGSLALPFPTPFYVFGPSSGYPDTAQFSGDINFHGQPSGPFELSTVVNMPSDVVLDSKNVWKEGYKNVTIAGMVHAIDAKTGQIKWQRPAIDGVSGTIASSMVFGSVSVANGVVYAGYTDRQGTIVALNADNGKKLFQYNNSITFTDNNQNSVTQNQGGFDAGPAIVDGVLYWGIGGHTTCLFPSLTSSKQVYYPNCGNSVIAFELDKEKCH